MFHFKLISLFVPFVIRTAYVGCEVEKAKISTRISIWRVNLNALDNLKSGAVRSITIMFPEIPPGIFSTPFLLMGPRSSFYTLVLWWDCPATLLAYLKFMSRHFTIKELNMDQSLNDTLGSFASLLVTMEPDHKFPSPEKELYWPFAIY